MPELLPPVPPELEIHCVVCGRTTVFVAAVLPRGVVRLCGVQGVPGRTIVATLPSDDGLCWSCWRRGWWLVRGRTVVG